MLKVTVVTPLEKYSASELSGLYLETITGHRGILRDHMPLVAQLKNNSLVRLVQHSSEIHVRLTNEAFLKFSNNEAVILAQGFTKEREDFCPV